jgi:CRP/FNR family transcriptional regulator, cyclic AMP receptor protein
MDIEQRRSVLQMAGIFALLSPQELDQLASHMTEVYLSTGETLFRQGEDGDAFYVVASGRARVVGKDSAGREVSL